MLSDSSRSPEAQQSGELTMLDQLGIGVLLLGVTTTSMIRRRKEDEEELECLTEALEPNDQPKEKPVSRNAIDDVFSSDENLDDEALQTPSEQFHHRPTGAGLETESVSGPLSNEIEPYAQRIPVSAQPHSHRTPSEPRQPRPTDSGARRRKWFALLPFLLAAICFAPRLGALWRSTETPAVASISPTESNATQRFITKPIEEIRPGDRVLARNPEVTDEERAAAVEPDPKTWRLIEMLLTAEDGHEVHIRLLRPLSWINQHGAIPGGKIQLDLDEIGASGYAGVISISPCPDIKPGNGQVVTGAFRHVSENLVEVQVEGQREPITCTSGHPFWSEDRKRFVDAVQLEPGERLRSADGSLQTVSVISLRRERTTVFNLEVNSEHVYYVGGDAILVHNSLFGICQSTNKPYPRHRGVRQVRGNPGKTGKQRIEIAKTARDIGDGTAPRRSDFDNDRHSASSRPLPEEPPNVPGGKTPVYDEYVVGDSGGKRLIHDSANNRLFYTNDVHQKPVPDFVEIVDVDF